MPLAQDIPRDIRNRSKRRGPRMNSRVPITIEWRNGGGPLRFEAGFTRVVNPNGCLLVSQVEPELKQHLRVTNVCTRRTADALVVWKGSQRSDGWDVGVELQATDYDFWGVEL